MGHLARHLVIYAGLTLYWVACIVTAVIDAGNHPQAYSGHPVLLGATLMPLFLGVISLGLIPLACIGLFWLVRRLIRPQDKVDPNRPGMWWPHPKLPGHPMSGISWVDQEGVVRGHVPGGSEGFFRAEQRLWFRNGLGNLSWFRADGIWEPTEPGH
jgi:hypothetical protein